MNARNNTEHSWIQENNQGATRSLNKVNEYTQKSEMLPASGLARAPGVAVQTARTQLPIGADTNACNRFNIDSISFCFLRSGSWRSPTLLNFVFKFITLSLYLRYRSLQYSLIAVNFVLSCLLSFSIDFSSSTAAIHLHQHTSFPKSFSFFIWRVIGIMLPTIPCVSTIQYLQLRWM